MTGPEHYREAERNIEYAKYSDHDSDKERFHLAAAQVHATLALAEAYVAGAAVMRPEDRNEWDRVTGRLNPETAPAT